jgi:hypothetical protein
MGWTRKRRAAERKMAAAKTLSTSEGRRKWTKGQMVKGPKG